jgi:hypothetical protein
MKTHCYTIESLHNEEKTKMSLSRKYNLVFTWKLRKNFFLWEEKDMKILVVLAHPDKTSFKHTIAKTVVETLKSSRYEVIFHDLSEENVNICFPQKSSR